jgi:outer membrane protein assembly factor BamD
MHSQLLSGRKNQITRLLFFCLVVLLGFTHCSSKEVNKDDPEALYADAEEAFKDEHYLIALEKYRDIKNRFPYSSKAVDAELRIADTYFEQESYLEAESSYEIFRELHPTHPKSDYVQYRIGLSYYDQIPGNTARDLSAAYKAIEGFNVLVEKYPSSTYVAKAKEYVLEARKKLAEHESYVADFYYQRQHYLSASYRYAALLHDYPSMGYDEEALYRLARCYYHTRMFVNAQDTIKRFISQFPGSSHKGELEGLMQDMSKKG